MLASTWCASESVCDNGLLYLALKDVEGDHRRNGHEQAKRRGDQGLEHAGHHRVGIGAAWSPSPVMSWAALMMPNTVPNRPT